MPTRVDTSLVDDLEPRRLHEQHRVRVECRHKRRLVASRKRDSPRPVAVGSGARSKVGEHVLKSLDPGG